MSASRTAPTTPAAAKLNRKGKKSSLHLELPSSASERPAVAALFVVHFDVKAGYTISWKRTAAGVDLANSVEFKSLPSGLHNVAEDLVYFVHEDQYAGISAFINNSAAKHERGALMLAVGALIPLENGRLGRSWRHADMLKMLAKQLVKDASQHGPLEEYWNEHKVEEEETSTSKESSGNGSSKPAKETDHPVRPSLEESAQAQAKSMIPGPTNELSLFHPARSMPTMLEAFGPLIYPIYKAALLRKRVLFVIEAPVELACNFVYNISILSNIPSALSSIVPLDPLPVRLQPLFSVGVHDIDALAARNKQVAKEPATQLMEGWVACTTDDVLCHKKDLYDIVVKMPPSSDDTTKAWPTLQTSGGINVKANQRDVRRYRNLRKCVERRGAITTPVATRDDDTADDTEGEEEPLLRPQSRQSTLKPSSDDVEIDEKLVEPVTWSALAYSSFLWWASAGEKGAELDEESERDQAMFQAFEPYTDTPGRPASSLRGSGMMMTDGTASAPEMAVIAYFHRMTTTLLEHLSNLVDDSEEDEDAERRSISGNTEESPVVVIEGEDLMHMGLDPWNESDRVFVAQLVDFYWGRKADVRGGRIECCGVRIC